MRHQNSIKGFTLIELLVSVGISAVLMVGMAAFFSSTFRNMFEAREKVTNNQGQFVVNSILHKKLSNTEALIDSGSDFAILENKLDKGGMPFTYIGLNADRLIFKDFFVFNGMQSGTPSSNFNLENPAGIVRDGTNTFVATPLENEIKICANLSTCSPLGLNGSYTELNHPTDLTFDSINNLLYITDSGNGRIISVDFNNSQETELVIDDLDFPTGIAHHNNGTDDFLFFAESYSNQIKRYNLNTAQTKIIAGAGNNEACNGINAEFCELNFPTGLLVQTDSLTDSLYIADTGNNRILQIQEPNADLNDFALELNLDSPTQVSRISFTLPEGTNASAVVEGASGNTFHPTKFSTSSEIITMSLQAEKTNNFIQSVCSEDSCTDYFRGFYVNEENNIFANGDEIEIEGDAYSVSSVQDQGAGTYRIIISPSNTTINPVDNEIIITTEFSGTFDFHFDLSLATNLPGGYQGISVEALDENNDPIPSSQTSNFVTIPDTTIGSEADQIIETHAGLNYATGLGWSGSLEFNNSAIPEYDTPFTENDYQSEFEIQNLNIETLNGGDILNIEFEALESGTEADDTDEWKNHSFKANITP